MKINSVLSDIKRLCHFEAVLRPACDYANAVQVDKRPTIGLAWIQNLFLKVTLNKNTYKVCSFLNFMHVDFDSRSSIIKQLLGIVLVLLIN